jgi:hypothetical protein
LVLLAGAFELVPLLVVLTIVGVAALLAGGTAGAFGSVLSNGFVLGLASLVLCALVGAIVELVVRQRESKHVPEWVWRLDTLSRPPVAAVGGKALALARLVALGAPVPEGIVLTSDLVARFRAAGVRGIEELYAALPPAARRDLDAFFAASKGRLVVRPSFTGEANQLSYAGVFGVSKDVDPKSREAFVAAVLEVAATADDPVAIEYGKRLGARPLPSRAVIVQRRIDGEITGTVVSRGLAGVTDSVVVEYSRRRSPLRTYRYDLIEGRATLVLGDDGAETPAFVHRLAVLAVVLEGELGNPVKLDFAIQDGKPYVLGVRAVPMPERKSWVHAAPLDTPGERQPTFARELRGGLPLVKRSLEAMLARAGAEPVVQDSELRVADGLVYVDAAVVRRALSAVGRDVLLRGGLRATLASTKVVARRPLPDVPTVTDIAQDAWQKLRAFHGDHLLAAAEVRAELVGREWLVRVLLRLVDGSGASVEERRGHPFLRWLLVRRAQEATEEADRQLSVLSKSESELAGAFARVLARSAAGWNAMFKGDRHLHATLDEIDAWHADIGARDALEAEWKSRGTQFDQRRGDAVVYRVHRPAPPEPTAPPASAATSRGPARVSGMGVVEGVAAGPLVVLGSKDGGDPRGAIVAFIDPRAELCTEVYGAAGVVLLTGGLGSPVAELALELGIPTVLCPGARSLSTREVQIDGTQGTVMVRG